MPEPVRICPYYRKPCAEARNELHLQGQECDFITRMVVEVPSPIHGAPPSTKKVDICIVRSLQQSLNALHHGIGIILQSLPGRTMPPGMMPFSKG